MSVVAFRRVRHRYSIYGAELSSDIALTLPGAGAIGRPLAHVELYETGRDWACDTPRDDRGDRLQCVQQPGGPMYLRWPNLFEFTINGDGTDVAYRRLLHGSDGVLQNFLLGAVLSCALVRQGHEQVHAAVLDIDGAAVGFLGDCGFGKSTLAAAFLRAGHRLVADDVLAIDERADAFAVFPGSGRIKLEPAVATAVLTDDSMGIQLKPLATKCSYALPENQVRRARVPLSALFVLPQPDDRSRARAISVQPLSRAQLMRAILRNTFNDLILDRARLARQFTYAAGVASTVDGYALSYPSGVRHLSSVVAEVVRHLERRRSATGLTFQGASV